MVKNKIVEVIPLLRLKRGLDCFSYQVPKKYQKLIKKGQLVEIPFKNKIVQGIVFNFSRENKSQYRLKSIQSIIEPEPFLSNWQLNLIDNLSQYYFVSMGALARMMVAEIPKREVKFKKIDILDSKNLEIADFKLDKINRSSRPLLIKFNQWQNKIKLYLQLIDRAIENKEQILIIVPQLVEIEKFKLYLSPYQDYISIFLNDLSKGQFWQNWLKIKKGQIKVIIGTRSAIFAPFENLGTIIIDQEENQSHKQEEPNPRYQVKYVAELIRQFLKAKLFLTSSSPALISLNKVYKKEWDYWQLDPEVEKPQLRIIDRNNEFKKENYGNFSEYLKERIDYNLKRARRIFLFLNRKGWATMANCKDCGFLAKCPTCQLPLTLHANKKLTCHYCHYEQDLFLSCPQCQSTNIKITGTGTEKLEQELKAEYPLLKIIKIDNNTPLNNFSTKNYDIIIGTQYSFNYLDWQQIKMIGVINADNRFYLPDYRSMEKTFNLLIKLSGFLNSQKNELIVQTFNPENYVFKALTKFDLKEFYIKEMKERKDLVYPPYCQLIRLIYQSFEFNYGQNQVRKLYQKLKNYQSQQKLIVLPPQLAYTQQVRGRWRWQIVLKILKPQHNLDFLNNLEENIIIDPDPESLL